MPKPRNKYPKQRVPQNILKALEDARTAATLENASFDGVHNETVSVQSGPGNTRQAMRATTYIRDKVRLRHDTWIIGPIDKALAWAKGET